MMLQSNSEILIRAIFESGLESPNRLYKFESRASINSQWVEVTNHSIYLLSIVTRRLRHQCRGKVRHAEGIALTSPRLFPLLTVPWTFDAAPSISSEICYLLLLQPAHILSYSILSHTTLGMPPGQILVEIRYSACPSSFCCNWCCVAIGTSWSRLTELDKRWTSWFGQESIFEIGQKSGSWYGQIHFQKRVEAELVHPLPSSGTAADWSISACWSGLLGPSPATLPEVRTWAFASPRGYARAAYTVSLLIVVSQLSRPD